MLVEVVWLLMWCCCLIVQCIQIMQIMVRLNSNMKQEECMLMWLVVQLNRIGRQKLLRLLIILIMLLMVFMLFGQQLWMIWYMLVLLKFWVMLMMNIRKVNSQMFRLMFRLRLFWMLWMVMVVCGQERKNRYIRQIQNMFQFIECVLQWLLNQLLRVWIRLDGKVNSMVMKDVVFRFRLYLVMQYFGSYRVRVMKLLKMKKQYRLKCQMCSLVSGVSCLVRVGCWLVLVVFLRCVGLVQVNSQNSMVVISMVIEQICGIMCQLKVIMIIGVIRLVIVVLVLLVLKMFIVVFWCFFLNQVEVQVMLIVKELLVRLMNRLSIRQCQYWLVKVRLQIGMVISSMWMKNMMWLLKWLVIRFSGRCIRELVRIGRVIIRLNWDLFRLSLFLMWMLMIENIVYMVKFIVKDKVFMLRMEYCF